MRLKVNSREKVLADNTIRKCSPTCYFFSNGGPGCRFYQAEHVKHGELCKYDLEKLKQYTEAFLTGDNTIIKSDASQMTATIMMQLQRMLEQVNVEGVTLQEPILDSKGNPIYIPDPKWHVSMGGQPRMVIAMRTVDHPLINRVIQLTRSLGINLSEFKLTPKSADEKATVSGHIIVEKQIDMATILKERKKVDDRFREALERGNEMTKRDPVFQQLVADGEITQ